MNSGNDTLGLYPYQKNALKFIAKEEGTKLLIAPTGAGKTYIAAKLMSFSEKRNLMLYYVQMMRYLVIH